MSVVELPYILAARWMNVVSFRLPGTALALVSLSLSLFLMPSFISAGASLYLGACNGARCRISDLPPPWIGSLVPPSQIAHRFCPDPFRPPSG